MTTPESFAPGYRLTDGNQLNFRIANPQWSTTSSVSATAGGTMQTSAKIVNAVTNITNASVPGAGVTLPQALEGTVLLLTNNSANDVRIFAEGDSTINGLSGQIGILLTKGTTGIFVATATKQWSQLNTTNSPGIFNIPNINALRALTVNLNSAVLVEGYTTPGDGGGGYFYGVSGGSYTDNGGTIIVPGGGTGTTAWLRAGMNSTTLQWGGEPLNVRWFGADNTGVVDATTAIQNAIGVLTNGATILFQSGSYLIGQIVFSGLSNLTIICFGAKFTLNGDSAGFHVYGVCAGVTVLGGTIVGDGVNRDSNPGLAQVGWLFGNAPGAYVQNVNVYGVTVDGANVGFKCAAGTGVGSGNCNYIKIESCYVRSIVGTVGGVGYGFQFSQASNSVLSDCIAVDCGRHGIYLAEGRNYTVTNCIIRDHRSTYHIGGYRVACSVSRSRNVAISNVVFDNCYDGSLEIDVDTGGTPPDNTSIGTAVTNCTFLDSALADIRIGTAPLSDGVIYDCVISNCVAVRQTGNAISSIVIEAGYRVKIMGCELRGSGLAGSRAVSLNATDGAAYTELLEIYQNTITNWDYGFQIPGSIQTGTDNVRILNNNVIPLTAEFEFLAGEDATTNNLFVYNKTGGYNGDRAYTSSGSNVILPVGGVNVLRVAATAAASILNFSGGVSGQTLTLVFWNANTTLLAAGLYLQGSINFTPTAYTTVTFVCLGSNWFEISRSIN